MPIQRVTSIPAKVQSAITQASERTGASFDYLLNTAKRESSLRTQAKSSSSSAAGLFQFVEGTWLKVVKEDGDRLGLADLAKNIQRTSSGKYYVPDSAKRREILELRHDPETSALVAAAYTEQNANYVRGKIGRNPSDGELYLAHFLGPGGASRMIQLSESRPDSPASRYFPSAAKANKSIFYDKGEPRSMSQVQEILVSSHVDGDNSDVRKSSSGNFAFGIMGGLISDTTMPSPRTGKGREGSIGVWGSAAAKSADVVPAGPEQGVSQKLASASAQEGQLHSHAARQYGEAAASVSKAVPEALAEPAERPSQSAAANKNWKSDALFSDN
ncbi:MAG: lytic transglycosylase domain-containing protein [Hyphomicrobiaceae bacterium]|nr:lytic transglycosylase domain-containing protein [Hyphomicrobiaceae bacterium]